jgi:uncharacterized membrane protein
VNFPAGLFPVEWSLAAFLPLAFVAAWCLRAARWRCLAEGNQSGVWAGSIVVLSLAWSLKAGVLPGLNLHVLGATAFTLMFGAALAIPGLLLVLAVVTLNGGAGWDAFALNGLVMAAIPGLLAQSILRAVERWLPPNYFVYLFAAAFFGAGAVVVATGLAACLLLWAAGVYPADRLFSDYFPSYILLAFAEAWLNGAAMALLVVFRPSWVSSFDDRRYFFRREP